MPVGAVMSLSIWMVPLVAFLVAMPWLLRSRWRITIAAVLCLAPAFAYYEGLGYGFLPLGVALPFYLQGLAESWRDSLKAFMFQSPQMLVIGAIAYFLAGRHVTSDTAAGPPLCNPFAPTAWRRAIDELIGPGSDRASRCYAVVLFIALPGAVLLTGFYPWNPAFYPRHLVPVGSVTMSVIYPVFGVYLCVILAHLLTRAAMGPQRPAWPVWKRMLAASFFFFLLRLMVGLAIAGLASLSNVFMFSPIW